MNEPTRSELEWVKQRQTRLEQELSLLSRQLQIIEGRLTANEPGGAPQPIPPPPQSEPVSRPPAVPPPLPPIIQQTWAASPGPETPPPPPKESAPAVSQPHLLRCECRSCGGAIDFSPLQVGDSVPCPHCGELVFLTVETRRPAATAFVPPPPASQEPPRHAPPPAGTTESSFEMRLGTYWLVRIGIVMLLTGLVFFGNYAYRNYIANIGPLGRVMLLYTASGLLLAAGTWWQRKASTPALRNYAQVLFAGGLAAVYFTTYAAHYVPRMQVITSQLLDGILLFAWTIFMVWIADRKKSEVLALFSILLAYYTSVMTRVGSFTLYSNLLLTLAAVFFLVRNRWAALSFASLIATYAAYAFWRFFDGAQWHLAPAHGLWHGAVFLIGYWVVFTAAVFLSRQERFAGASRTTFLTLNNVQFFLMFLLTMLQVREGGFWKFSLIYGSALLALAALARQILSQDASARNSYLIQGLLLVTIGIIAKFSGLQLALLLAAESVVLLTLGSVRKSLILQTGACLVAALSVGWGIDGLDDAHGMLLQISIGAFMAFNAFWSHLREPREDRRVLRALPSYFTVLAMISWLATTSHHASPANLPWILAVEALALTASVYLLRVREFAVLGQGYLVLAHGAWLLHFGAVQSLPPWWNPVVVIAITLALSHWWQRQNRIPSNRHLSTVWQALFAMAIIALTHRWLRPLNSDAQWIATTSALAIGITAYGVLTRSWLLAAFTQVFVVFSILQFAAQLWLEMKPMWVLPLTPIATLLLMSLATGAWFRRRPESEANIREPLLQIAILYRWAAMLMSLWWIEVYIPARERIWVAAVLGFAAFLIFGWRKRTEALWFSAVFTAFALAMFWIPLRSAPTIYLPNLLAIAGLLAQQRLARRLPNAFPVPEPAQTLMISVGSISSWLFLSRWLIEEGLPSYLTPGWGALALVLFLFGMATRERIYRWLGLAVLACAVGRVVVVDVWKLQELYRILSIVALAIVLLVLGFIYSKYQEKIKEWL